MSDSNCEEQAPLYGPCGCCLWTPPPSSTENARALIAILLLTNIAMAWLVLYAAAHPGWR